MQLWESVGKGVNITTAYINDIPGTGVKKSSRWPPPASYSICKQPKRKQHVIPDLHTHQTQEDSHLPE